MGQHSNLSPFFRGDTKIFNLSFEDSNGQGINITGHELWFTMKRVDTDADEQAILQKRVIFPSGEAAEKGVGVLSLSSEETKTIEPGTYVYDIQKVIPETPPVVATFMSGKIRVLPDITQNDGT